MELQLVEVASGLGFCEGPVALEDGSLLFVQIDRKTLCCLETDGHIEILAKLSGGPNGIAIGPDGAAYVCNNGGAYSFMELTIGNQKLNVPNPEGPGKNYRGGWIERIDLKSGKVKKIYTRCDGDRLLSPDDIVFSECGGFWFTATGIQTPQIIEKGGVYYATPDGKTIRKVANIPSANGIGISPDGTTLFVADTLWGRLWSLDITGPGEVAAGPLPGVPGNVVQTLPGYQWLDSLKIEADGRICVGTLLNGGITIFQPDGSTEHFAVPDLFTTNLCFAGEDMKDVFITASSTGKIYKTRWPRSGLKLQFGA